MSTTIPQKIYHVYLLIDSVDGIFYVGSGNATRLRTTISGAKSDMPGVYTNNKKNQKIREIWRQGREVQLKVVFSSDDELEVRRQEAFLIRKYGERLTNYQGVQSSYPLYIYCEGEVAEEENVESDDALLALLRGQNLLKIMQDPAKLKDTIELIEKEFAFLEESQRRLYPDFTDRTMRSIVNRHEVPQGGYERQQFLQERVKVQEVTAEVQEVKMIPQEVQKPTPVPSKPRPHVFLELAGQSVGVFHAMYGYLPDDTPLFVVTSDAGDITVIRGSKDFDTVDGWVRQDAYNHYSMSVERIVLPES